MKSLRHLWERLTCGHVHDWQPISPLRLMGKQDPITLELQVIGDVYRWRCQVCSLVRNVAVDYSKPGRPNGVVTCWTSREHDDGTVIH
jgi:hypothetical protein